MAATAQTARRPLSLALVAQLETVPHLNVFLGDVPDDVPVIEGPDGPDSSGRVAPYAVVHGGAGEPGINPSLAPIPSDFVWRPQVTFAAGYTEDLLAALDRALPAINLWSPVIAGVRIGHLRPALGFDPGTFRRDDDIRPPRFYVPTLWQLHLT